jgi:DNA repair protein RecN (Recombination protein N)
VVGGEPVEPGRDGIDQVVFLFAPNPGEEPQPLSRIASGGELSRVSLGLQLATRGEREAAPTLIFDEVDVGVGGAQAAALGRKLRRLSASGQILAVTHLPQVASYGHHHLRVSKAVEAGRTSASVEVLREERRVEEVARMLAGREVTELSVSHARELLDGAAAEEPGERAAIG